MPRFFFFFFSEEGFKTSSSFAMWPSEEYEVYELATSLISSGIKDTNIMVHTFVFLPLSFCLMFHSYSMLTTIHSPKREITGKVLCLQTVSHAISCIVFDKNRKQQQQTLYQ